MDQMISVKELRQKMDTYARRVKRGESFVVLKRSKPIFRVSSIELEERWETVIDFTKIKKGGVDIDDLMSRL
jgi:prevent-host-death family protein